MPKSREDRAKLPCMYFAYDSCTKGAKCPYLHDKNNLFKGPKPQALQKSSTSASAGAATVSAGVARVIAGAAVGSTIKGAEAARASCSNAPSSGQEQFVGVLSDAKCKAQKFLKRTKGRVKQPGMFEKAFKCIAAMAALTDPTCLRQEFLIDSGAGRNLISKKSLPEQWVPFLDAAPESLKFSTGGGIRNSSEAVHLRGEHSGDGIFYTLHDCPAALSLGQQVNEQGKAWVWFPNQLPFFIKPERLSDVTFHCPESAKIYADRVVENDPILSERVECVAMPAEPTSSSHEKPAEKSKVDDEDDYAPSIADPEAEPGDINEILDLLEEPVGKGDAEKKEGDEVVEESSGDDLEELDMPHNLLTHFPKSKTCEICKRAKMTSRYHRRKHDIDPEETPPLHFGHQLTVDHIILEVILLKGQR